MARRQPVVCWAFDAIGCIAWIAAALAFWDLKKVGPLAGDALTGGVFWQWLAFYSDRLAIVYIAPIVGTLFLGFSALIKQVARVRSPAPYN